MTVAYCWRSGQLEFGRVVPEGAVLVLRGPDRIVREVVEPACRLAYDNKTLLVPGVPEAETDEDALASAMEFIVWIDQRVRARGKHRRQLAQAEQVQA